MKSFLYLSFIALTFGLCGCGGNVSTVSGKVTLEGNILDKGDIGFHQAEGMKLMIVCHRRSEIFDYGNLYSTLSQSLFAARAKI